MRALVALLNGRSGFAAAAQTGLATAGMLAINLATGMLCARFLGPEGRGELSALLLGPQLLSFLFTLGLPVAFIVRVKDRPDQSASLMGAALTLSLGMGALAALAGCAAMPRLLGQYDASVVPIGRGFMLFALLGVASTVLVAALQVRDRFSVYNRVRFGQSALVLPALLGLVAAHELRPAAWALAYLLPTLPFLAWTAAWALREFAPTLAGFRRSVRSLVRYGYRVHAVDAAGTMLNQIDKVILVAVLDPAVFGVYMVAFNLSRLVTTFAAAAIPVLLPRAAGRPLPEVLALTARALGATMVLTAAGVLGFAALGELVLRVLYGVEFASGYAALLLLALQAALASAANLLQQPYLVASRAGIVAAFQVLTLTIAAGLVFSLGRSFGAEGAAAGLLAATGVRLALLAGGYATLLGVPAPRLVPLWSDCVNLFSRLRTGAAG